LIAADPNFAALGFFKDHLYVPIGFFNAEVITISLRFFLTLNNQYK
tara:strand:+ start:297 stop:434 length:138 start_codon:yes stop_codon:yes gene_type:complete